MTWISPIVRVSGIAAAAGMACLALTGCGDRSEAGKAAHEASLAIGSISAGGSVSAIGQTESVQDYTIEQFAAARATLGQSGLDGTDAEKAAALILSSWADLGLASGDGFRIGELEAEAVRRMARLRSALRGWEELNARALAEEAVDPSTELGALQAEYADILDAISAAEKVKTEVDQKVSALNAQIDALRNQSKKERDAAASLELRAAQMTAVEAAQVAPEIQKHALAAEKKLLEVERLQAQSDQLATEATEASLNLEMLRKQIMLNQQAQSDIQAASEHAKQFARELRAQAVEFAGEIQEGVDALLGFRDGSQGADSLNGLFDAQIAKLRAAAGSARQGMTEMRTEARIAAGCANAALGDALSRKARSYSDLSGFLSRLADANPSLAGADSYEQKSAEAAQVAETAAKAAEEAYQSAAENFSAANARGEARELVDALVEKLRSRAGRGAGGGDEQSNTEPEGQSEPEEQPEDG